MKTKKQILKELQDYKKMRFGAEFARFLGISPGLYTNWLARNTFNLQKIISAFPEIRESWLLTGEGPMLKTEGITIGTVNDFSRQHAGHDINNGPVISQDPQKVAALEAENEHLKQTIEQQERLIQSKDELINTLKTLIKA